MRNKESRILYKKGIEGGGDEREESICRLRRYSHIKKNSVEKQEQGN
jgi:hypothetical protein